MKSAELKLLYPELYNELVESQDLPSVFARSESPINAVNLLIDIFKQKGKHNGKSQTKS
jgi:hypothetical protein